MILRTNLYRDMQYLLEQIPEGSPVEIRYEAREVRAVMGPLGTVWELRRGDTVLIEDPVDLLYHRHHFVLPSGILGAFLLFIVVPFILVMRRLRASSS